MSGYNLIYSGYAGCVNVDCLKPGEKNLANCLEIAFIYLCFLFTKNRYFEEYSSESHSPIVDSRSFTQQIYGFMTSKFAIMYRLVRSINIQELGP